MLDSDPTIATGDLIVLTGIDDSPEPVVYRFVEHLGDANSEEEVDPISAASDVGRALVDGRVGDTFKIRVRDRSVTVTVRDILST